MKISLPGFVAGLLIAAIMNFSGCSLFLRRARIRLRHPPPAEFTGFEHALQRMENFRAHTQGFLETRSAFGMIMYSCRSIGASPVRAAVEDIIIGTGTPLRSVRRVFEEIKAEFARRRRVQSPAKRQETAFARA